MYSLMNFILKVIASVVLAIVLLVAVNHYTDNKVIAGITEAKKWSQKTLYSCKDYIYVTESGTLELEDKVVTRGFSKCIKEKESEIKTIDLSNVRFKNFEEARLISDIVKENGMDVVISGSCGIECLDIAMHSQNSKKCNDSEIKIRRIDNLKLGSSKYFEYMTSNKEKHMMSVYKESDVNVDFLLSSLKGMHFYKSKELSNEDLINNNLIDEVIDCKK